MRTYLITGGTGSLGKAIIKKLLTYDNNTKIVVLSRDEAKHHTLSQLFPDSNITSVVGDVRDYDTVRRIMSKYGITNVLHAAAMKRVDSCEKNPHECYKTNIGGTHNVCRAFEEYGSSGSLTLISTDKACNPINAYGASKLSAEKIVSSFAHNENGSRKDQIYSSVRYGNVIASRGSFIPIWKDLMLAGQRIKIYDPNATRFLFTLVDATEFVLRINNLGNKSNARSIINGSVCVPHMYAYKLMNVAKVLQDVYGGNKYKKLGDWYELENLTQGEKPHEDLINANEALSCIDLSVHLGVDNVVCIASRNSLADESKFMDNFGGMNSLDYSKKYSQKALTNLICRGIEYSEDN